MGETASSIPGGLPQPAAHMDVVRTRNREGRGECIVQQALYKDPKTGRGCEFWQVTRSDRKPLPTGHLTEIFPKKHQAETFCQKLEKAAPKKTGTRSSPLKVCEIPCVACGVPFLERLYRGQRVEDIKRTLCLECWKKEQNAKNKEKGKEMGLPDFTIGTPAQIAYAYSVRQLFVDGILNEINASQIEAFLSEVKAQKIEVAKWWLDHNAKGTLKAQFQSLRA